MLLQFGRQIHRIADDRLFETGVVADGAKNHGTLRHGKVDRERLAALRATLSRPFGRTVDQVVNRAKCICSICPRRHHSAKRRHDSIAHKLIDAATVALNDRHQTLFVFGQQLDHVRGTQTFRNHRKSTHVALQDCSISDLAVAGFYSFFGTGDTCCYFGREKSRQITGCGALCQRRSKSTPLASVKMHHLMRFSPPGQPWAGLSGFWGFPPFLALVETVAVAVHLQDMNVVCEPVQQRPGQALGTEHLGPLIER